MDIFTILDAIMTIKETAQAAQEAGILAHHEALADAFWATFHAV